MDSLKFLQNEYKRYAWLVNQRHKAAKHNLVSAAIFNISAAVGLALAITLPPNLGITISATTCTLLGITTLMLAYRCTMQAEHWHLHQLKAADAIYRYNQGE